MKKIFIVAGEASGDLLGAGLIAALKEQSSEPVEFYGIAGPLMQGQGCRTVFPMERLSIMGIWAILKQYYSLNKQRKALIADLIESPPDVFIGIDAPEYNTEIEYQLRNKGIKTIHYVSPSIWAWRAGRLKKIKQAVDLMLTLFTFEPKYYEDVGVAVKCVGHPLADDIPLAINQQTAKHELGLNPDAKTLAILPGSRRSEVKYLVEPFIQTAKLLADRVPELICLIPAISEDRASEIELIINAIDNLPRIKVSVGNARQVMSAADAVLIASGTATLEAALLKKPMVVGYRMAPVSYAIFSRMLNINNVSLPNLLADRPLVAEYIQNNCVPEKMANELLPLLIDPKAREEQISEFERIHRDLRKDASSTAAKAVAELIELN